MWTLTRDVSQMLDFNGNLSEVFGMQTHRGMEDNLFFFIPGLSLSLSESRSEDRLLSPGHSEGANGLRTDPL